MESTPQTARSSLLLTCALALVGCYPAASESVRMDMVRRQAALDLKCPADRLTIQRDVGFTYRVDGCGKQTIQDIICLEDDCRAEARLTHAPADASELPDGVTAARRLVNPGADDEEMPMPNRLATLERPYAGTFRICVAPSGAVERVQVVKGTGVREVDDLWQGKLRSWRYEPYRRNGEPVSGCHDQLVRYEQSKNQPQPPVRPPLPDDIYVM